jgi:hypothetical protein
MVQRRRRAWRSAARMSGQPPTLNCGVPRPGQPGAMSEADLVVGGQPGSGAHPTARARRGTIPSRRLEGAGSSRAGPGAPACRGARHRCRGAPGKSSMGCEPGRPAAQRRAAAGTRAAASRSPVPFRPVRHARTLPDAPTLPSAATTSALASTTNSKLAARHPDQLLWDLATGTEALFPEVIKYQTAGNGNPPGASRQEQPGKDCHRKRHLHRTTCGRVSRTRRRWRSSPVSWSPAGRRRGDPARRAALDPALTWPVLPFSAL